MAYDPSTGLVIMFGGSISVPGLLNDTWAYDPAANTWTNLRPTGTLPNSRDRHSMVYDPSTGRVLMFGGTYRGIVQFHDIWAYTP